MCCCEVNPVLYRRKCTSKRAPPPFHVTHHRPPPNLWTWVHVFPSPVGLCIHSTCALQCFQCVIWLQFTNRASLPLPDTGAILASSSDAHHPSVRSPCGSLQAKVTGSHSSSSLAFCPRVQVVWKCVPAHVCLCGVCAWVVCLSCHKLHSARGEALQESSALVTDRAAHTHREVVFEISSFKRTCYTGVWLMWLSPHTLSTVLVGWEVSVMRNCCLLGGEHWSVRINCG